MRLKNRPAIEKSAYGRYLLQVVGDTMRDLEQLCSSDLGDQRGSPSL